jgi:hypothetical protein
MKLASFDLEIMRQVPDEIENWLDYYSLGISCAAVALSDKKDLKIWKNQDGLTRKEAKQLVKDLQEISKDYNILTWNGASFDFQILAEESGLFDECAELAINHIDMMIMITFTKGYFLGLQKVCEGMGIKGKVKQVKLNNGTWITDMKGNKAPILWRLGEFNAVLEYLVGDVLQPIELAQKIIETKSMTWKSNGGNQQKIIVPQLLPVKQCFKIPKPDTSWMNKPPTREHFVEWMPEKFRNEVLNVSL